MRFPPSPTQRAHPHDDALARFRGREPITPPGVRRRATPPSSHDPARTSRPAPASFRCAMRRRPTNSEPSLSGNSVIGRTSPMPHSGRAYSTSGDSPFGTKLVLGDYWSRKKPWAELPSCGAILNLIKTYKRRGRDSNPRYVLPYTAFPVPHNRPLCHLSGPTLPLPKSRFCSGFIALAPGRD